MNFSRFRGLVWEKVSIVVTMFVWELAGSSVFSYQSVYWNVTPVGSVSLCDRINYELLPHGCGMVYEHRH